MNSSLAEQQQQQNTELFTVSNNVVGSSTWKIEKTVDREVRLQVVKLRGRYLISSNILHLSDSLDVTMKKLINTLTKRTEF